MKFHTGLSIAVIATMIVAGCTKKEDPATPDAAVRALNQQPVNLEKIRPHTDMDGDVTRIDDADAICYVYAGTGISCIPKSQGLTLQLQDDESTQEETDRKSAPKKQM